jgi:glutamyl-tRNA reductase
VAPEVGRLPDVRLFNLDDLEGIVAKNIGARESEIQRVNVIVAEEAADFQLRNTQAEAAAVIARLRAQAEQIRQECLAQADRKQALDETALASLDYLTDLLVRKLLHKPMVALRELSSDKQAEEVDLASAAARLFDLNGTNGQECTGDRPETQRTVPLTPHKVSSTGG